MSVKWMSRAALAAVLFGGVVAGAALAQAPADMAAFLKARHDHFHQIGHASKDAYDELKKPAPSIAVLQASGKTIEDLSAQLPSWFPAGTGPETGLKTDALATIWQKPAEFKKAAADFATAAHGFNAAAQSGNLDATKAAFQTLGGACKACHTPFRAKDEH